MKIINKNAFNIMYGMDFIKAGEIKDIEDKKIVDNRTFHFLGDGRCLRGGVSKHGGHCSRRVWRMG